MIGRIYVATHTQGTGSFPQLIIIGGKIPIRIIFGASNGTRRQGGEAGFEVYVGVARGGDDAWANNRECQVTTGYMWGARL